MPRRAGSRRCPPLTRRALRASTQPGLAGAMTEEIGFPRARVSGTLQGGRAGRDKQYIGAFHPHPEGTSHLRPDVPDRRRGAGRGRGVHRAPQRDLVVPENWNSSFQLISWTICSKLPPSDNPVVRNYLVQPSNLLFTLVVRPHAQSSSEDNPLEGECPRTVGSPWGHQLVVSDSFSTRVRRTSECSSNPLSYTRPHTALDGQTPDMVYFAPLPQLEAA